MSHQEADLAWLSSDPEWVRQQNERETMADERRRRELEQQRQAENCKLFGHIGHQGTECTRCHVIVPASVGSGCVNENRERMKRPWTVMRLSLTVASDQAQPPGGDFLIAYGCPLCGALVDWRHDGRHLLAEGCHPDAVNYLVIEQEQFAGVR